MSQQSRTASSGEQDTLNFAYQSYDGEAHVAEELVKNFRERHPSVDIDLDLIPADNFRLDVKSQILRQSPPSLWAEWPGQNLTPYHDAGILRDLTPIWEETGMDDAFLEGPKRAATFDGEYNAIPLNIHRANGLFYRRGPVEAAGVDPRSLGSPEEFLEACEQVSDATGTASVVLPMKNPWPVLQLWEMFLMSEHGAGVYREITQGNASANRQAVADALQLVKRTIQYTPEGALFSGLTDGYDQFVDQKIAFFPHGDWVGADFLQREFEYGPDWAHVPFPGTTGYYSLVMDAVVSSDISGGPGLETFASFVGSKAALKRFNGEKGSIPPRGDVDLSDFPEFLQQQQNDFKSSRQQPLSIAHGLCVTPSQFVDAKTAIANFIVRRDVRTTTDELVTVLESDS